MLTVARLHVSYANAVAVRGVSFTVPNSEIVAIIGPNGAGKTSLGRALAGLVHSRSDAMLLDDGGSLLDLRELPTWERARKGVLFLPDREIVFRVLTVIENLASAFTVFPLARSIQRLLCDELLDALPALKGHLKQMAGSLSGGEQRMLALARSMLLLKARKHYLKIESNSGLLILDEPSHGLHPHTVERLMPLLMKIANDGYSVLVLEQTSDSMLAAFNRLYTMNNGSLRTSSEPVVRLC